MKIWQKCDKNVLLFHWIMTMKKEVVQKYFTDHSLYDSMYFRQSQSSLTDRKSMPAVNSFKKQLTVQNVASTLLQQMVTLL